MWNMHKNIKFNTYILNNYIYESLFIMYLKPNIKQTKIITIVRLFLIIINNFICLIY
jgi:hypothetical protein